MSEKRPHFPFVAALLCAGCVGMAGYLWMRYSYCRDVAATEMVALIDEYENGPRPESGYLCLHGEYAGVAGETGRGAVALHFLGPYPKAPYCNRPVVLVWRVLLSRGARLAVGAEIRLSGRLSSTEHLESGYASFVFDTTASRFRGASIAGLVVGAMGVFVFTVALRHWLRERRAGG